MSIRTVLAVVAGITAGLIGHRHAAALRAEAHRLRRWTALMDRLHMILNRASLPLPEALEEAADSTAAPDELLHTLAQAMRSNPLLSLAECYDSVAPDLPEGTFLRPLMLQLDRGGVDNRLMAVAQAQESLQQLADSAWERAERDAGMWARLGWTGGACLTILLI